MARIIIITIVTMLATVNIFAQDNIKRPDSYNYMRGLEAMESEKYGDAIDYFNKEIQEHPQNGYAYYNISYIRYLYEEYGMALSSAEKAIQNLPKKDKVWVSAAFQNRAKVYLALEDTIKALADYSTAIKRDPENTDLRNGRGQIYYEIGDYTASDADYKKITEVQPYNQLGYLGVGRNFDRQGKYDEALSQYNQAIKLDASEAQPYTFRAETYWNQKRYLDGANDIVKALDLEISSQNSGRAWRVFLNAPHDALPMLTEKLKVQAELNPVNSALWFYYTAICYESDEDYNNAVDFYLKSYSKDAKDITANRISNCYDELGNYSAAIEYIDKAIAIDSTEYRYLLYKANTEYNAGNIDNAISNISEYIKLSPDYFGYYRRGWFKENRGDIDGAIADYNTSIVILPNADSYVCRGKCYFGKGFREKAEEDFKQALIIDTIPDAGSVAHYALFYLDRKEEAKAWMDKILDSDNSAGEYYDAACLYSLMAEKEQALSFLRTSLEKGYRRFNHIRRDTDLENIRLSPEFNSLIERYEIQLRSKNTSGHESSNYVEKVEEIPFTKNGSTYKVKCNINGLPLFFVFDTGASDISLSNVEASFMFKNGYIKSQDIIGRQNYMTASGEIVEGTVINIRDVSLGKLSLKDVRASVQNNQNAPLLLGQSVLNRLGKIEIDNNNQLLKITYKEQSTEK